MNKSLFSKLGLAAMGVALMGAGCSGSGSSNSAADAFDAGLKAGHESSAAVTVTSPKPNDSVTIPLHVSGTGASSNGKVYAGLYEFGNLLVESQVDAKADGSYDFSQIWLLGEHESNLELRVGEKDEAGNSIKFTKVPLTVNPAE